MTYVFRLIGWDDREGALFPQETLGVFSSGEKAVQFVRSFLGYELIWKTEIFEGDSEPHEWICGHGLYGLQIWRETIDVPYVDDRLLLKVYATEGAR